MTDIQDFPYPEDTAVLFERIRHLENAVWLDSGKPRSLQGRFDIISAAPLQILESRDGINSHYGPGYLSSQSSGNPFVLAQELLGEMEATGNVKTRATQQASSVLPFTGGLIGNFGYSLGKRMQGLASEKPVADKLLDFPEMRLGFYAWAWVINHQTRQAWLVFHPACPEKLKKEIKALSQKVPANTARNSNQNGFCLKRHFSCSITKSDYLAAIAQIKQYIVDGDCYQANYAQHFSAPYEGDPWHAYLRLRDLLPSPFSAYLEWDKRTVLCLSPERFLKVSNDSVESKPIKGTIRRGATIEQDDEAAIRLINSPKDRAENLMIVDLMRNDLGKSCQPSSIRVPKLFGLESFTNVHHLVSTVTGRLREGESALSTLQHCFPGGSITGAPKKRAMEIIDEVESQDRSLYCGSIGYISCNGRMDTNIVIRTLFADGEQLHCWSGGGIVADSDPETEYQETLAKVSILLEAFGQQVKVLPA